MNTGIEFLIICSFYAGIIGIPLSLATWIMERGIKNESN